MIARTLTTINKSSMFTVMALTMFAIMITGCATTKVLSVKTKSDYKKVWNACLDSLSDVRFSASSTDTTSGLIIADQAVVGGHGTVSRLNIQLSNQSGSTIVVIRYVPPPGTVGGGSIVDNFVKALKQRLPDIETIVIDNKVSNSGGESKETPTTPPVLPVPASTAKVAEPEKTDIKSDTKSSPQLSQTVEEKVLTPPTNPAPTNTEKKIQNTLILRSAANIRSAPNDKSKVKYKAKKGEKVIKLDSSGSWLNVKLSSGLTGWVFKDLVKDAE